jgi:hypothetical protein
MSMVENPFDFLLFFAFDQVRGWPRKVRAIISGLLIRREE